VLFADQSVDLWMHSPLGKQVPAENFQVVLPGEFITEPFHLNGCFGVAALPQEMYTFSENRDPGSPSIPGCAGSRNETVKQGQQPLWVNDAVEHECREGFLRVEREIATLLDGSGNVYPEFLHFRKNNSSVRLGSEHNSRMPALESVANERGNAIEQRSFI